MYRTLDSGEHWSRTWTHPGIYVRALEFVDETTGYLGNVGPGYFADVRDAVPLYVTHDAGKTWAPVRYTGPRVIGICAIDVLQREAARLFMQGARWWTCWHDHIRW